MDGGCRPCAGRCLTFARQVMLDHPLMLQELSVAEQRYRAIPEVMAEPARMVLVVLHRLAVLRSVVRPKSDQPSGVAPFDLIPC